MREPVWFPQEAVPLLHAYLLELFGGSPGLRDEGGLEAALARPQNLYVYGESGIFELAATYVGGIVRNHPFIDGNKRTGLAIALTFLETNGYITRLDEDETVQMTLALAAREIEEEAFARWLEANSEAAFDNEDM